ncbi:Transposon Ty3-I Gag-Pol polyprotein [Porphyridium purpureum]|uniref:RNA-directed DNA polymerase n=1 Tax=Porphyridium purpureum TaxID=35688 RepID=A0A5J4YHR5_PORPP|nr:Transposon Ty3-I Gag-Pol polyprotein [Porphyridium purpureum]|eukprot:POR6764..scf289_17
MARGRGAGVGEAGGPREAAVVAGLGEPRSGSAIIEAGAARAGGPAPEDGPVVEHQGEAVDNEQGTPGHLEAAADAESVVPVGDLAAPGGAEVMALRARVAELEAQAHSRNSAQTSGRTTDRSFWEEQLKLAATFREAVRSAQVLIKAPGDAHFFASRTCWESHADTLGLARDNVAEHISACFGGPAVSRYQAVIKDVDAAGPGAANRVWKALESMFFNVEHRQALKAELRRMKFQPGKASLSVFLNDLETKADGLKMDDEDKKDVLIEAMDSAFLKNTVRMIGVSVSFTKLRSALVDHVGEDGLKGLPSRSLPPFGQQRPLGRERVGRIGEVPGTTIQKRGRDYGLYAEDVYQVESFGPQAKRQALPTALPGQPQCWQCGELGHLKRDCRNGWPRADGGVHRPAGQGGAPRAPYSDAAPCMEWWEPGDASGEAELQGAAYAKEQDGDSELAVRADNSPTLRVKLTACGQAVVALAVLDTGANSTWVSPSVADRLGLKTQPSSWGARGPDGASLGRVSVGFLDLHLGSFVFPCETVRVAEHLKTDLLIGWDFQVREVAAVLPGQAVFFKRGGSLPFEQVSGLPGPEHIGHLEEPGEIDRRIAQLEQKHAAEKEEALRNAAAIELGHLEPEQRKRVGDVLAEAWVLFRPSMGLTDLVEHTITVEPGQRPLVAKVRRRSEAENEAERSLVEALVAKGVLQPSTSECAAANVLIRKPDGSYRMTTDFRPLNAITIKDRYPIPDVGEMLDWLSRRRWKSALDLKDGFFQVPLAPESMHLTAMITREGLFEYTRLPQGCCNSPPTFQRLNNRILGPMRHAHAQIYIDDLTVGHETFEEHVEGLRQILRRFAASGLTLSARKCKIALAEVQFLGHRIGPQGLRPGVDKTRAILEWPEPEEAKDLQRFLGLVGWFRNFIPNFEERALPLRRALTGLGLTDKKGGFHRKTAGGAEWASRFGDDQRAAFIDLRHALGDPMDDGSAVLVAFNPAAEMVLEVDASQVGIGAVLLQGDQRRPVAFYSRAFRGAELNYSVTEQECLGAILSMEKFRHYLFGKKFILVTDHSALLWLLRQKEPRGRTARWIMRVQDFEFDVKHKPGAANIVADALSRTPLDTGTEEEVREVRDTQDSGALYAVPTDDELRAAYAEDEQICAELKNLSGPASKYSFPEYIVDEDGIVFALLKDMPRRVVPDALVSAVLNVYHGAPLSAHMGTARTAARIADAQWWWPGWTEDVRKFVRCCHECIARKAPPPRRNAAMVQYSASRRFEIVGMDILTISPETRTGNIKVLVMMDAWTRWAVAVALPDEKAETVARSFLQTWLTVFGPPESILSDRGSNFVGEVITSLCARLGIRRLMTTAYHPQTNGRVERFNATLCKMLSAYVSASSRDWDRWLSVVTYAYNTSRHAATGFSPYEMMFGSPAKDWASMAGPRAVEGGQQPQDISAQLARAYRLAGNKMSENAERFARYYDRNIHRNKETFAEGDIVYVWCPSTRQGRKLTKPWLGPFRITKRNGVHAVVVSANGRDDAELHGQLVHVNRLHKADPDVVDMAGTNVFVGGDASWVVEAIVEDRAAGGGREYKVRWRGMGKRGDTWEAEKTLPPMLVAAYRDMAEGV